MQQSTRALPACVDEVQRSRAEGLGGSTYAHCQEALPNTVQNNEAAVQYGVCAAKIMERVVLVSDG